MVSALYYEQPRETAARASDRDLRDAADMHRRIYQAIRARNPEDARREMHLHLIQASEHQAQEPTEERAAGPRTGSPAPAPRRRIKRAAARPRSAH